MGKFRNSQDGFGAVEIIAISLVVVALAASGLLLFRHSHKSTPKAATAPTTSQSTTPADTTSTQPAQHAQPAKQQYLVIKEWGVQLPLTDDIKDAYYTTASSSKNSDGSPNTAWLGLTSLNNAGCNIHSNGPNSTAAPIGSIVRVAANDSDPVTGTPYTQQYPNGTTIGSFYYAYKPWSNRKCASAATLQSIDTSFATAAKSITKTTVAQ
jgi:hypothetical protein